MFTAAFWKAATERALKSAAQVALLIIGADQFNALQTNWGEVGGFALGGLVLSYLFSVGSAKVGGVGPSLANEVTSPPAPKIEA